MDSFTSTRRHFLSQQAFGLGGLALASLIRQDELRAAVSFLDKHATSRPTALADLAWALLASAEFRLNH